MSYTNIPLKPPCCNNFKVNKIESKSIALQSTVKSKRTLLQERCAQFKQTAFNLSHSLFNDTNCYYMGSNCRVEHILPESHSYGSWRNITSEIGDLQVKTADLDDHDCLTVNLTYKDKLTFVIDADYYCYHNYDENDIIYGVVSKIVNSLNQLEYALTLLCKRKLRKFIFSLWIAGEVVELNVHVVKRTGSPIKLLNIKCEWPDKSITEQLDILSIFLRFIDLE